MPVVALPAPGQYMELELAEPTDMTEPLPRPQSSRARLILIRTLIVVGLLFAIAMGVGLSHLPPPQDPAQSASQ
jgi:hypothetical protein